ncbi:MAG: MBL fold metallo-hydrolase, partial [Eubacterium sp.]|nr:MBL fold metallo-hydrolase [Eubacterium sp.]
MQLYSIASGSSGNCIYVGTKESSILIDAGISMKRIREGLEAEKMSLEGIQAIFITHEHTDHISGLGPVLRKVPIPVDATAETISAIWEKGNMIGVSEEFFHAVAVENPISLCDMDILPVSISHDAANPVCYTVRSEGKKVGVATDMGCYTTELVEHLKDCDSLLLEANHDINLLQVGSYPYSLKMRILGERGHLSNDASARLIQEILHPGLQHVVLGHLSQENNFPELAYQTVSYELENNPVWNKLDTELLVANRH